MYVGRIRNEGTVYYRRPIKNPTIGQQFSTAIFSAFTASSLTWRVTFMKTRYLTEALDTITIKTERNGLNNTSFPAPIPAPGVAILSKHMTDLQTGLNAVYDALGRARPTFDSIMAGVTAIGKSQMEPIRNVTRALE